MSDDLVAIVIEARPNAELRGAVLISVTCPHCGLTHHHGVPPGEVVVRRTPHCNSSVDYRLDDPMGLVAAAREPVTGDG